MSSKIALPSDEPVLGLNVSGVHSIWFIHHFNQLGFIVRVNWTNRNISNRSELTTVVQVFILQSEEVPYKPPEEQDAKDLNRIYHSLFVCEVFLEINL